METDIGLLSVDQRDIYVMSTSTDNTTINHFRDHYDAQFGRDNRGFQIQSVHAPSQFTIYHPQPAAEANPDPFSTVPFARDPYFIGRESILSKIDEKLDPLDASKHRRTALVGLAGVG